MINTFIKKKQAYLLLLIIIIAAIFQFLNLTPGVGMNPDGAKYAMLTESLVRYHTYSEINYPGHPPETRFPPMLPLILSPFYFLFPGNFLVMKAVIIVLALISFYVLFYLLKEYTSIKNSLWITLIVSLSTVILMNTGLLTETLYFLLTILTLFLVKKSESIDNKLYYLAIPLSIVAALLIRAVGLTLLLSVFIYYLLKKKYLKAVLIPLITFILQLPWIIRNSIVKTGITSTRYVSYKKIFLLNDVYHPYEGYVTLSSLIARTMGNIITYIRVHLPSIFYPVFYAIEELKYSENIYFFTLQMVSGLIIFLVVGYGFLTRLFKKLDIVEVYVVVYTLILVIYQGAYLRFLIPLSPFLILYFFDGLSKILDKTGTFPAFKSFSNPKIKEAILHIVIISIIIVNITANLFWINMQPYTSDKFESFFEANEWIKENTDSNTIIGGTKPNLIYFYSNRSAYSYPYTLNKTEMANTLYELNTDYVIIDSFGGITDIYLIPVVKEFKSNFTLVYKTSRIPNSYVYKVN